MTPLAQDVATDLRPDPIVGDIETVGGGSDRRSRAVDDRVERNGRASVFHLDRRKRLQLGVDPYLPAPITKLAQLHGIDEGPLRCVIRVRAKHDSAPLAALRCRANSVITARLHDGRGVGAEGVVVI